MLLIKLIPEQIARYWDYIRYSIEQAARTVPVNMSLVLESLLANTMQCWTLVRETDDYELLGCFVTTISENPAIGYKALTIYSAYGYEALDGSKWVHIANTLVKYASSLGCNCLDAYVESDILAKMLQKFGCAIKYYICLEFPK